MSGVQVYEGDGVEHVDPVADVRDWLYRHHIVRCQLWFNKPRHFDWFNASVEHYAANQVRLQLTILEEALVVMPLLREWRLEWLRAQTEPAISNARATLSMFGPGGIEKDRRCVYRVYPIAIVEQSFVVSFSPIDY